MDNGNYLDLATLHKEFNIAYILPLYITQDPKIVGYEEKSGIYYNIPETELNKILASQKLNYSALNKLPFYAKYGGKLVAALIIALLIWSILPTKKSKVEPKQVYFIFIKIYNYEHPCYFYYCFYGCSLWRHILFYALKKSKNNKP